MLLAWARTTLLETASANAAHAAIIECLSWIVVHSTWFLGLMFFLGGGVDFAICFGC